VYRSDALTPKVMAEWRSEMATKVGTGKMASKSFNNVFTLAGQIFRWARHPARAYMAHDPLIGQKRLKLGKKEAEFLEADDVSALLAAASGDAEASALVHVMLFGGLRRSEAFGLKWSAVETNGDNGGRLRVCRTIYQREIIEKTKSDSSNRMVDVPRSVIDALARHGEATPPMDGDVVFRTSTGQPPDPNSWYSRVFKPLRERAGLREGVGLHSLRHNAESRIMPS